jgi:hypothetical protein
MKEFLAGAVVITFAANGLFFWRFWKKSGDRFYALFAAAFWVMALNRFLPTSPNDAATDKLPLYYAIRLLAFLLILVAIIDKNYSK